MLQFLSSDVRDGLEAARKQAMRRRSRMSLQVGDEIYPILRYWQMPVNRCQPCQPPAGSGGYLRRPAPHDPMPVGGIHRGKRRTGL